MNINPIVLSLLVFFASVGVKLPVERLAMRIFRRRSVLLLPFVCVACGKALPELEGVDRERWVRDKNGCAEVRLAMRDAIASQKEKLLALDQMQIVDLLGKPDQNELSSRNQKFFYYFLEPAPACADTADSTAQQLVIRFNAMGLAKEVLIQP